MKKLFIKLIDLSYNMDKLQYDWFKISKNEKK